jgi:hypothetical protein
VRKFIAVLAVVLMSAIPVKAFSEEKTRSSASSAVVSEKEQHERSAEDRLRMIGKRLDELKARTAAASDHARKDMKVLIADAEKKQQAAAKKLNEMRRESSAAWKKVSSEMDRLADEFEQAYEKAKSRFKE